MDSFYDRLASNKMSSVTCTRTSSCHTTAKHVILTLIIPKYMHSEQLQ